MSLKLIERAVPLTPHTGGEWLAAGSHDGERLKRRHTGGSARGNKRVQRQIGEEFAQPERWPPQPSEHLKGVAKFVKCNEIDERLKI
jgi:hypothetical protein